MMQPTVPAREWQPDVLRLRGVQNVLVLRPPPTTTNTQMEQDDCNSTGIPNAILFPDPITPTHPLTPALTMYK